MDTDPELLQDDPAIADDEDLWRRVKAFQGWLDPNGRPTSAALHEAVGWKPLAAWLKLPRSSNPFLERDRSLAPRYSTKLGRR